MIPTAADPRFVAGAAWRDRKLGPMPHGLDPDWMPERAALMRRYGPERHLHFPPHLQGLAGAIDRLYFNRPAPPWEKEWDEEDLRKSRARIVRALRHRAGEGAL